MTPRCPRCIVWSSCILNPDFEERYLEAVRLLGAGETHPGSYVYLMAVDSSQNLGKRVSNG